VKGAPPTNFPKAPKGLPIDFYDVGWFNSKLPAQGQKMANINEVMFVKNPNNCLRFTDPLQQLGTKRFTKARWDEATKAYNLDFLVPKPKSDSGVEVVGSEAGESIDLNNTDGEEDDEEDDEDYPPAKALTAMLK
jgi:hypothetical protein